MVKMTKNRVGQSSIETIWKSRWMHTFDKLKNNNSFALKNGYPTKEPELFSKPPSYREYASDLDEKYHKPKPRSAVAPLKAQTEGKHEKTTKDVSRCLRATNLLIGILLTISMLVSVIGTTTPYWFDTGTLNVGLFQSCTKTSTCDSVSTFTNSASASTPNTWMIVTVLNISGCCVLLLSVIFYCIYVHCTTVDYRKVSLGVLLSIVIMLGAGAMLSGMAVMITYYFDNMSYTLNWSFYLSTSGGGLALITFCIMFIYVFVLAFQ